MLGICYFVFIAIDEREVSVLSDDEIWLCDRTIVIREHRFLCANVGRVVKEALIALGPCQTLNFPDNIHLQANNPPRSPTYLINHILLTLTYPHNFCLILIIIKLIYIVI